ncbi:nucleotidyl transferase AbiEii/AbiGii toxin family protein [Staphylococcus muscae]|uniref:Abortive infection protein n=1 Tax=Staphylococcus muscae TaxID=1294 RepID=A0A240C7A8_9STAP|nr:nucleotidyl transferase AbiEii/AbiGii toxin family protein [Staphylococcus muscae]AVQ33403.1 nucleotidyl transferase AbiEii/AbiGii toxin family protein [Staphylococcus muscae]PNZ03271.1 nucleotidyl transferase AbiEii/AbiGii toxin family protein [Staphylococcus muscae]GGA89888.1 abortive infection protein [Staphylococcus muscae]SNW03183.1 Nucleotidyl transferase of uncharacterised function (DUF1814) [Staphylococcus muscae]
MRTYYFLESILKKLSNSSFSSHYIFKGGFLLSNVIGMTSRITVDIDFLFDRITLSKETVYHQLTEILAAPENNISFTIQSIKPIRKNDDYGGYRAIILCQLENIKQVMPLYIATGDFVTPFPITYKYQSIFDNNHFSIIAYTIETILAEKLQTIYSKNFLNSRSKAFYDIYILSKLKHNDIDFPQLRIACTKTFSHRHTELNYKKFIALLESFKTDHIQNKQWQSYSKKHSYTKNILFKDILHEMIALLLILQTINSYE